MNTKEILKAYMLEVYKWTGDFEVSDGWIDCVYDEQEFQLIKAEILSDLKSKSLNEDIVSDTIVYNEMARAMDASITRD